MYHLVADQGDLCEVNVRDFCQVDNGATAHSPAPQLPPGFSEAAKMFIFLAASLLLKGEKAPSPPSKLVVLPEATAVAFRR